MKNNDGNIAFVFDNDILDKITNEIQKLKIMKKGNLIIIRERLKTTIYSNNENYITYVNSTNVNIKLYVYDLVYNYLKKDYKDIILDLEYKGCTYTFCNETNTVNTELININIKK